MDKEEFNEKIFKLIKNDFDSFFNYFNQIADELSSAIKSDAKYYQNISCNIIKDLSNFMHDNNSNECQIFVAVMNNELKKHSVKTEIKKVVEKSNIFLEINDNDKVESYIVKMQFSAPVTGDKITITRIIDLCGSFIETFEKDNILISYNEKNEIVVFNCYHLLKEKNNIDQLILSLLEGLNLTEDWDFDYLSISKEKEYLILKKKYQKDSSNLLLSVLKKENEKTLIKFTAPDTEFEKTVNELFRKHDLSEIKEASNLIDINYLY